MSRKAIFGELISELTKLENFVKTASGMYYKDPEYTKQRQRCYDLFVRLYGLDSRVHWNGS